MQTMIHHATIVTTDDACTVHYDAAIVIEADRIAAIGPTEELLARYPAAERIDGRGKAVMPGFANVDTHLAMTLARGIYEDLSPSHTPPFVGGLAPLPLPQLSVEEHQVMCQLGVVEALRSGTTLVLEDGAVEVVPLPVDVDVRLIHAIRVVGGFQQRPAAFVYLGSIPLDPAEDGRMVNR